MRAEEVRPALSIREPVFPTYVAPLLNLANQVAQGTRPAVVGQMSDLIEAARPHSRDEWERWYTAHMPAAPSQACDRIERALGRLQTALAKIDRPMIESWVNALLIDKTYAGFVLQGAILHALGQRLKLPILPATTEDERRGIDGYIGDRPVSIKPSSYLRQGNLIESLQGVPVFYEKTRGGIKVDASALA
ncbi:MAG: MjaI family restriction endonuclease [Phycisphaerales bacterium]